MCLFRSPADKKVFGVPLVLFLQRTGQTVPTAIHTAFKWLKLNALDQVCFSINTFLLNGFIYKQFILIAGWFIPEIWCEIAHCQT